MPDRVAAALEANQQAELTVRLNRGLARVSANAAAEPAEIIQTADRFIDREQIEREKFLKGLWLLFTTNAEALGDEIGAAWGEQVCRAVGWRWAFAVREKSPEPAIVSHGDRHLIFPQWYVRRMVLPPYEDNTLLLTFNMIVGGKLPDAVDGALEDLTGAAKHIIPKRDRPRYRGG